MTKLARRVPLLFGMTFALAAFGCETHADRDPIALIQMPKERPGSEMAPVTVDSAQDQAATASDPPMVGAIGQAVSPSPQQRARPHQGNPGGRRHRNRQATN